MATRKRLSKKTGNNNLLIFFAIVIALALISMIAAYFMTDKTEGEGKQQPKEIIKTEKPATVLFEGTWVSNYNGTMLTIKGLTFTLESPAVDESTILKGKISIEKDTVTFIYESGTCKGTEGKYQYTLNDKGELFFKLIRDNCSSRKELMTASWFKF